MRRLVTIALTLVLCGALSLGAPASGETTPPEHVTVTLSGRSKSVQAPPRAPVEYVAMALSGSAERGRPPASVEYVHVALAGRTSAHHGQARHARRCKRHARSGRHGVHHAAAHANRRGHVRARRCRAQRHGGRSPSGTPHTVGPAASGVTGAGNASTPAPATGSPAPGSSSGSVAPPTGSPPAVPRVQVTATEYSYKLSRTSVPAGRVIVEFVNRGQDEHNLKLMPGEGELAGSFPDTLSGGVSDQSLILRAGSYTLFCSLPEHESKGMKATLHVQ